MKRTRLFILLGFVLVLILTACGQSAPAPAAPSAPAANAEAKATEAPTPEPTSEPTPEPTPEPTSEPTPEPTPEPKRFTLGVLTDKLYRNDYLGFEVAFAEADLEEYTDGWKYERNGVCFVRDGLMTDEKAAEIIADKDKYYVDMGVTGYRANYAIEIDMCMKFAQADSDFLSDDIFDPVTELGRTTLTIGDREWEIVDKSYDHWAGRSLVYERDLTTYQDSVKARFIISITVDKQINAPYDQVKVSLDELTELMTPIDDSAPAPTSKPLATPEPEPVPLAVERDAAMLETEGLKITVTRAVIDWKGDLSLTLSILNTTNEIKYVGVPSMGKLIVNGAKAAEDTYGRIIGVNPGSSMSFTEDVALSQGSLAGILAEDIQEIQIPFTLYKTRDLGGNSYTYDVVKDLGYGVLKVDSN